MRLRSLALLAAATVLTPPRAPRRAAAQAAPIPTLVKQVSIPHSTFKLEERADGHRPRGSQGAGGRGQRLVQCRLQGRAGGQDRLRPSVRASDVQRLARICRGDYFTLPAADRRDRLQRHHLVRPHQLFRDGARPARSSGRCSWKATAWAICSARSTRGELDNQRGVVQNEKRQGDNQPCGLVEYAASRSCFPAGHPYHHTTIGSMADLDAGQPGRREAMVPRQLRPQQCGAASVAGDITPAKARPLVEKYFGAIPRGPGQPSGARAACRRCRADKRS